MKEYIIDNTSDRIRYHDLPGEKMPVLFIHGLGCASSFDYPEVVAQDSLKNHRCILVDLLGAGYSDKPEAFEYTVEAHARYLKEFIEYLNLGSFVLFGHSLGGAVALALADKLRNRIHKIVLSEPNLDKSAEGSTSKYIANFELQDFTNRGFHKLIQVSRERGNQIWAASLSVCLPESVYLISKSAAAGGDPSWREILYSFKCSKTLIFGETSLPDPDVPLLKKQGIHIEIVKNAGHSMAWENPRGLASAIYNGINLENER